MKKLIPFLAMASFLFLANCSPEKKDDTGSNEEMSNEEIEDKVAEEAMAANVTGYTDLNELSKELVASLKANDYEDYLNHVMTEEMEKTVVNEIKDKEKRDFFLGEFGFSLEREKEEFTNLVSYLKDRNVSLDSINFDEVEVIDYHHDEYAPLTLKEVVIVVPHEYDVLLIYTAIKIKDRWYLTSELEV